MKLIAMLAGLCTAIAMGGAAEAQTLGFVTTPPGSFSNSAGTALAKVIGDKAKLRIVVQPQAGTGFPEVNSGDAELLVSNSFDATFAVAGVGEYQAAGPAKNIRYVGALIPYRVALHVRANSPIKTIADLKGKRIASGFNAQKTIGRIIEAYLALGGLTWNDVEQVPAPNVVRAAEDFASGKTDVLFFAIGSAAVKQASAAVGGLRVLPADAPADRVAAMGKVLPGAYLLKVAPDPGLDGISEPTTLVAFDMVMIASNKVPDDRIYRIVKAIHDSKPELVATFGPFALFDPAKMAKPNEGVPFHPGALKYYKEIGIAPKT
jgi:TRAP transporter TAXI family solute receptor